MWLELDIAHRFGSGSNAFHLQVALQCRQSRVVLCGPSGAGKSVTLKAIAGLLHPQQGCIELLGQAVFDAGQGVHVPAQQRRLGYVFQDYALFPHLTVRQNVGFGLSLGLLNPPRGKRVEAVEHWLRTFGIEQVGELYPDQISGGQRQRTALARALVTNPRALLLDEPFAALDHDLRGHLRRELEGVLDSTGIPLLLVSHDPEDVAIFGQQVITLAAGKVQG